MSSYSFSSAMAAGRLDILGVIDWIAGSSAQHLELAGVGLGADLLAQPDLVEKIRARAQERGVALSAYAVAANFRDPDRDGQIAKVKSQIDIAHRLGIPRLRHDVLEWAWREKDQGELEDAIDRVVPACRELADYAAERGITTSVENHGFCMNGSDRIRRLVHLVDRPNFRTTVDVGNFLCVGEQPVAAVGRVIGIASNVHVKDFYIRDAEPGGRWLRTLDERYLRGSIVGFGDVNVPGILASIKQSGYDGPLSIEFEGIEDSLQAAEMALQNVERIWEAC